MKILAVDTATNSCSVAVTKPFSVLAETTRVSTETHSKHLLTMIAQTLEQAGASLNEMDGFAVTRGPGSFTGLRIGLSVVKGLAMATGKPVVGVSSLKALAFPFLMTSQMICVMIDARKSEVYMAGYRYQFTPEREPYLMCEIPEQVLSPDRALAALHEPCLFVGSGAAVYHQKIRDDLLAAGQSALFAPSCMNVVRASAVAQLGLTDFRKNHIEHIATLKPHYIRKSDAEIKKVNSFTKN
jgi:tRNA threonylcarbamoyladenosine biosynthesis protein TsaB